MASASIALRQLPFFSTFRLFLTPSPLMCQTRTPAAALVARQYALRFLPAVPASLPAALHLSIPSLLSGIWESILRAVPKKKTSHSKSRHRQMAGKALKDVTALNKCSACGNVKRAHLLCPYCVQNIKDMWAEKKNVAEKN